MFNFNSLLGKGDNNLYNKSIEDFIPIACHYDANTLLTKNGELLQIIQIQGINSEKISAQLFNLRTVVRNSIKNNVNSNDFAFWIHTVRYKANLDDTTPYNKLFSANIHNLWQHKNSWDDKFVNSLYISIIYDGAEIKIKNFKSFVNSFFFNVITDFQNKYLDRGAHKLTNIVDKIQSDLKEFSAIKLGIRFEGDKSFSDPMSLYRRVIHLNKEYCLVPIANLSQTLVPNNFVVGGNKIEIIDEDNKKFIGIISIKEYQEISSAALDGFLQLPLELIVTEIFNFIDKKNVVPIFEYQDYILKVSGDSNLSEIQGINKIINPDNSSSLYFCNQQISIAIIESNVETLEQSIVQASQELAKIGIVHMQEDINLEQTFWAQLPGNFSFLRRMTPTILENIAAFASLHHFPTGNQYNIWGKAVTLFKTEKSTPYFMNFHSQNNRGNSCIFGTTKTGKTILTNFLISEATKYNPTIIYLSNKNDSKIFIEAIAGQWYEKEENLINPFLLDDTPESRTFTYEFLKIICNHYAYPLTTGELVFLEELNSKIFTLDNDSRNFSAILKMINFSSEGSEFIQCKLSDFIEGGLYHGIFDDTKFSLSDGTIIGLNLYHFSEESFTERFYPTERKFIDQFTINLSRHNSICAGLIYALNYHLTLVGSNPKILAIDNMDSLCRPENFSTIMNMISSRLMQNNGIMISNFNFHYLKSLKDHILQSWLNLIDTKIILPSNIKIEYLDKILALNKAEIDKLSKLTISSRMFLMNQNNQSIVLELSISSFIGITRILSARLDELRIYQEILQQYPGDVDNWINHLYNALNHI